LTVRWAACCALDPRLSRASRHRFAIHGSSDATVSIHIGQQPNPRITIRDVIKNRDLAVVVLLDLSESTHEFGRRQ
jgi:nitric oxide reductase activation protein